MKHGVYVKFLVGLLSATTLAGCAGRLRSPEVGPDGLPFKVAAKFKDKLVWNKSTYSTTAKVLEQAQAYLNLLKPQEDPYWGVKQQSQTCDPMVLPPTDKRDVNKELQVVIHMHATAQRNLGLCSDKLDVFKVQILFLACKETNTLYRIQYFYPREEAWQLEPVAACFI